MDQAVRLMALADRFEWAPRSSLTPHIRRLRDLAVGMLEERVDSERFAQIQASVRSADLAVEIGAALARPDVRRQGSSYAFRPRADTAPSATCCG